MIRIEVFPSGLRPHHIVREGPYDGVYVRLGSTNRKTDAELIAELKRTAEGRSFDEQIIPDGSIENIDLEAIKDIFGDIRNIGEKDLISMHLIAMNQGRMIPTIGGLLLFGKVRGDLFPDVWVQCGRFSGIDKTEIFDHVEIHEHLPVTIDRSMEFLKKHAMRGADLSGIRRKDVWSIPLSILREAIINAVVHADYSQRGAPIRISFFDDRIEVENPGILLPGLTIEDMMEGVSRIRNHVVARVFKELGLIEQWGSGVRRMFREAEELGLPPPEILEIGMRVRFIVWLKKSVNIATIDRIDQVRLKSRLKSELAAKVMIFLNEGEYGKSEIARKLGHRSLSGELHKQVKNLLNMGYIQMTIPEKPRSSNQKYRLTRKGEDLFKERT